MKLIENVAITNNGLLKDIKINNVAIDKYPIHKYEYHEKDSENENSVNTHMIKFDVRDDASFIVYAIRLPTDEVCLVRLEISSSTFKVIFENTPYGDDNEGTISKWELFVVSFTGLKCTVKSLKYGFNVDGIRITCK